MKRKVNPWEMGSEHFPGQDCPCSSCQELWKRACQNCGSTNLSTRDDSDPSSGYRDHPARPWCENCNNWAD